MAGVWRAQRIDKQTINEAELKKSRRASEQYCEPEALSPPRCVLDISL
jgi:hypothetical protein